MMEVGCWCTYGMILMVMNFSKVIINDVEGVMSNDDVLMNGDDELVEMSSHTNFCDPSFWWKTFIINSAPTTLHNS